MINVQIRDGIGWKTVTTRDGSELDYPAPVRASEVGLRPGDVCRLALVENGRTLRKRMIFAS